MVAGTGRYHRCGDRPSRWLVVDARRTTGPLRCLRPAGWTTPGSKHRDVRCPHSFRQGSVVDRAAVRGCGVGAAARAAQSAAHGPRALGVCARPGTDRDRHLAGRARRRRRGGCTDEPPGPVVPVDSRLARSELYMVPPGDADPRGGPHIGTDRSAEPVHQRQRRWRSAWSIGGPFDLGLGSRFATASAFHHQAGVGVLLAAWRPGPPGTAPDFSPHTWSELRPLGVTHATLVPALIEAALAAACSDCPTLECIRYGSSPLHPDTARRLLESSRIRFVQNFGQTEGSPITTLITPSTRSARARRRTGWRSVGRATEGTELRSRTPTRRGSARSARVETTTS